MDADLHPRSPARVRPGDAAWPSEAAWNRLRDEVGGQLIEVPSLLAGPGGAVAIHDDLFEQLKNPYFIADNVGLTQTCGWVDAWACAPSVYAVVPRATKHVVAAVNFARENN